MISDISFPVKHLSVRVPWHDAGWNGTVCADPSNNSACLKLKSIAEEKDEGREAELAGRHFNGLQSGELPPCLGERVAFMSPRGVDWERTHPYRLNNEKSYSHFKATPLYLGPYSAAAIPFRWMLKESFSTRYGEAGLCDLYPLDAMNEDLEPDLGFRTVWWQDHRNQTELLETFWAHVKKEDSLVFFYAKQVPLVDDAPGRRILVGVGRVKSIGPLIEYQYHGSPEGKLRSLLWERMIGHSIRADFKDGFLMPYHEALEKSGDGAAFDPAEVVGFAPEERFTEFSYATEHVGDDAAIEALLSMRAALLRASELFGADVRKQEQWIDVELGRLWRKRGPFPGMGVVLHANGVPMGNFIAQALSDRAGIKDSPWAVWFSALDAPADYFRPELANRIDGTIARAWKLMGPERRAFLELLSRVDLSQAQANALVTPEERRRLGVNAEDHNFIGNPYLLYEATRLTTTPLSINSVDRGLFPASSVRGRFPVPEPSRVSTLVDSRRLRALSIRELEEAAVQGDTLVPRERIIHKLRHKDHRDDEQQTLVTGDLLKVAEDDRFAGEVWVVKMANGKPAYQLERLGAAGGLIKETVERRRAGRRHHLIADWRGELDGLPLRALPKDEIDADERKARDEKAAALEEIANARISVLVGSAGTGKTTLLSALCKHPDVRKGGILLLAPTGKARVRMETAILDQGNGSSAKAYTLAQFLTPDRYDPSTQRYQLIGNQNKRKYSTVIVDESSMLTEEMLAALLESLSGVERLILAGDLKQLPPIGAGRPFVDIVERLKPVAFVGGFPRVGPSYAELTVLRRQQDVQDLDGQELAEWFGGEPGPSHDSVFEILCGIRESETVKVVCWQTPDELKEKLPGVLADHLGFDRGADETIEFSRSLGGSVFNGCAYFRRGKAGAKAEEWQILSPSRQKPWGMESLNRLIHQRYKSRQIRDASKPSIEPRFLKPQGNQQIVYGDKVINNRNRKLTENRRFPKVSGYLANGEVGMVIGQVRTSKWRYTPREMHVEFSTQPGYSVKFFSSDFSEERATDLELAYALTVHKAQGSEFKTVLLVLPQSNYMLSRELIYTALTRQTKKLVILLQGSAGDVLRISSEEYSDSAKRLTNLFAPPNPVAIGNRLLEDRLIHRTARGEAVRSKSEVIIANLLDAAGVDYRYEEKLEIGGVTKLPDFTIDDDDTGVKYYWEHLGMLPDERYRRRWNDKLKWLRGHGIVPREEGGGEAGTLIVTRDSDDGGIDSEAVSKLIGELFGTGMAPA